MWAHQWSINQLLHWTRTIHGMSHHSLTHSKQSPNVVDHANTRTLRNEGIISANNVIGPISHGLTYWITWFHIVMRDLMPARFQTAAKGSRGSILSTAIWNYTTKPEISSVISLAVPRSSNPRIHWHGTREFIMGTALISVSMTSVRYHSKQWRSWRLIPSSIRRLSSDVSLAVVLS